MMKKEEVFYDFYNNSFVKRNGFYIYYQKNETMHNYMLSINKPEREKPAVEDTVVQDIRSILNERRENKSKGKLSQYVYAGRDACCGKRFACGNDCYIQEINSKRK